MGVCIASEPSDGGPRPDFRFLVAGAEVSRAADPFHKGFARGQRGGGSGQPYGEGSRDQVPDWMSISTPSGSLE